MGAQLWYHVGPWRDEPGVSLREVQVAHLRSAFDYPARLAEHLASAREAVRLTEADDPYNLLDHYRAEVARFEELAAFPPPATPDDEIARLRMLYKASGEGIGCVLDVTHVNDGGGVHVARRLPVAEVARLCGADRPTAVAAGLAVGRINAELGRGYSVCFPFYDESGRPSGWCFVGNTID
ncbi:hypothetical protein [Limnoglobus roseus]|uniref:Uncharacterized protein n=1 Tax=Limnoglobus roseus TaxID=2598579 RepID=A0A5C1AHF3_9BACT|nr:hypothetical protein [Limnoglobus roseus]QEL17597.1 hypothetical protein PX52LOC_04593 [Limnoglobus roseus]